MLYTKVTPYEFLILLPTSSEIIETYPLPPPSTILGLISSMLREQELSEDEFNIAIQGKYEAIFRDYQWYIKYEGKSRYPIVVNNLFAPDLHYVNPDLDIYELYYLFLSDTGLY
jgi:CRISPR/Cas system-associated protein Cas5 (RAMP superfamily)